MKEKKAGVLFNFYDDPELYFTLDKYRKSLGWTWKRFFLIGIASVISTHEDNPSLVVTIADYLENHR